MHKHLFPNLGRSIVRVQNFVFEYYCIVFLFCFDFFLIFRYIYMYIEDSMQVILIRSFFFKRLKFQDIEKMKYSVSAFILKQVPLMQ